MYTMLRAFHTETLNIAPYSACICIYQLRNCRNMQVDDELPALAN